MFRTSHPVAGAAFHDRASELRRLESIVDELLAGSSRWLAIIGPRKIGKTSLIVELSRRTRHRDVEIVALDTQESTPLSPEFFRIYALRTVDAVFAADLPSSIEITVATGGELDPVLDGCEPFDRLPASVKTVVRSLGRSEMTSDFARVCLDLPERLAHALGRKLVIAVDEFQELGAISGHHGGDPLPLIRSVWQRHRNTAYIVSGSGRSMLEDMVSREHSPFFQHFALLYVEPFERDDAVALLTDESPAERKIPGELAGRIVDVLGGHPFYLQLLGEALTCREPPYDDTSLKDALQDLLFSRTGRLALYFELQHSRAVGRSSYMAAVLDSIATGPSRMVDIAHAIGARSADTSRYLDRLGDLVRKRDDGNYELDDPVFGLWLRWRRPGGTVVPMTVVGDAAEREVAEILARSGFELVYQSRASRGSFDLLATRGEHQVGIQVKRSPLPLRFPRATWNRMAADAKRFGWRWLIASVTDEHGLVFLDPGKARRGAEVRVTAAAAIESVPEWLEH